ncbi:MAG: type II toxin-antitoxin system RelE/ParE family toxin [Rhodanobacteraceae bacterium]|nr:type II toxin-antitoxin system RelE/ParE family toxin [Rhodanobacteraceae bacterium]MBL0042242.1 type II toxin-antitoxin system RelE/ParE family toxin [Xanthomonadales bacterium]MBP6079099.1 type II toxin-antitoxin system RelE/ParE family toxin [Xanthomonadales bacterium]
MREVRFLGSSQQDLAKMPASVRSRAGHELFLVQVGREPSDFKPMASVGSGVYEIRIRDVAGAFRVMYVARFKLAIYVLHVFQKKTRKTPPLDLQLAATRYAKIKE